LVENGTDTGYYVPAQGPEKPNSLIFAASLSWYPNISALQFFVREIWPSIKQQCPGAHFCVAGQRPSESLRQWLMEDPDIVVVPSPEDIRPWIARAAVFVCPMLDGGGTKLKILDAMAMGKPVVSTSIGCEGLAVSPGKNIQVADTPEDFANSVQNLLEDLPMRQRLAAAGRKLVEDQYSWDVIGSHLEQAYRCVQNRNACERRAELS
jgi:glycosyltransferase involved in cell wall biosynthesis